MTVLMDTLLADAVSLMLAEKQPCAMIVDDDHILIGLLTLRDIQEFSNKYAKSRRQRPKVTASPLLLDYFLVLPVLIFPHLLKFVTC